MSTTSRILVAFLLLLGAALFFLLAQLSYRVERQYLEAAEEPMVDTAQIFAALLEQYVDENGALDLATIRRAFAAARTRKFSAQIYNLTKTSVTTNIYVTDRRGIVLYDSEGGAAEKQDYHLRRDVGFALAGGYGARSSSTDPRDADSWVMYVAAPIRHAGEIVGVVSVSKPQRSLYAFRDETQAWIRNLGWVFYLAVAGGAYLVVLLFSRPIRRRPSPARRSG